MDSLKGSVHYIKAPLNAFFSGKEPWQVATMTASSVLFTVWMWQSILRDGDYIARSKKEFYRWARKFPQVKKKIDDELSKVSKNFEETSKKHGENLTYFTVLPEIGFASDKIISILTNNSEISDFDWKQGRVSGSVYFYDKNLMNMLGNVYSLTSYTNPLHPDIFPSVSKMEAEIVRMTCKLFSGGPETCGTVTTGGTESILLACKAYRDFARETRGITRPEIVMPVTAHAAFDKAGQYLGIRVKTIPVDPITMKVDVKALRRAITKNTIMLAGSAPNFPYGTMDDIAAISDLGAKYNIPVHVDACLGGFLIVFMEDVGHPLPPFDFRLPGVTSISADTHKYGFAPKGTSVVMYSDKKYLHHQYTVTTDWPGGVYGSQNVGGSRSGGTIATCWATLLHFGKNGYLDATRSIIHTSRYIEKKLRETNGIFVFGNPATSVVAIGSNQFDIYRLSSALLKDGWNLNTLQFPSGIHICVTHLHTQPGVAEKFIKDVRKEVAELLKSPQEPVEGKMAIYGVAQKVPDRTIVGDFTRCYLDSMYYTP